MEACPINVTSPAYLDPVDFITNGTIPEKVLAVHSSKRAQRRVTSLAEYKRPVISAMANAQNSTTICRDRQRAARRQNREPGQEPARQEEVTRAVFDTNTAAQEFSSCLLRRAAPRR